MNIFVIRKSTTWTCDATIGGVSGPGWLTDVGIIVGEIVRLQENHIRCWHRKMNLREGLLKQRIQSSSRNGYISLNDALVLPPEHFEFRFQGRLG